MSLESEILKDRAFMLAECRRFFQQKKILEVDCPHLVPYPSLDRHIDLFSVEDVGFLHSSPEYAMKKLLSSYKKDIYQLGHVFRKEEKGNYHLMEFTMAEWYRIDFSFKEMIEETAAFAMLFLGSFDIEHLTYEKTFITYVGIDPFTSTIEDLQRFLEQRQIDHSLSTKDDLLDLILAYFIEPKLGDGKFTVLSHYPESQAALAKVEGKVAKRFELYYKGTELANGYEEETDSDLIRERLFSVNEERISCMLKPFPIDEAFLEVLPKMPPCCGVSVGFDRLMMLRHKRNSIRDVTATFVQ